MTDPTNSERLREAVEILREHNRWRRGAETRLCLPPGEIGAAMDVICDLVPSLLDRPLFLIRSANGTTTAFTELTHDQWVEIEAAAMLRPVSGCRSDCVVSDSDGSLWIIDSCGESHPVDRTRFWAVP
jgi:hypothetical protein